MKLINQRTLEKLITGALVVSVLVGFDAPVFAQTVDEVPVMTSESTPQFPEIEKRVIPKATRYITVTAYSSDVSQNDSTPFLPANGIDYRDVFAATGDVRCIALNDVPLGTVIRIVDPRVNSIYGEEPVTVCDRKNARYNGKWSADMYTHVAINGTIDSKASLDEARKIAKQFGVKHNVKIEILEYGTGRKKQFAAKTTQSQTEMTLASAK